MRKLHIMVVTHKETELFENKVYIPIHVGKALSNKDFGYIGDNTGENISKKNPYYCELTAQYWGWKNIKSEYIGLCHYRRYFNKEFSEENIEEEINGYDMLVASKTYWHTSIFKHLSRGLVQEDILIFYLYMLQRFPKQSEQIERFFIRNNKFYPCNMFICKKELFDQISEWEFSILSDLEKIIRFSNYTHQKRVLGYIAETLLSYYIFINKLKVKEYPIVEMIGYKNTNEQSIKEKIIAILNFNIQKLHAKFEIPPAVHVGLESDGIFSDIKKVCTSSKDV